MSKLLISLSLVAALAAGAMAVESADERRPDTATYQLEESTVPTAGQPAQALEADGSRVAPLQIPAALADLRARHNSALAQLGAALDAARDQAERESLERQAVELKHSQQLEELGWLKQNALAKGDAAYASRLDEALRQLEPRTAPVATTFVPRDPVTGEALSGQEGGAQ